MNDLCHLLLQSDCFLFADDTTLSFASKSIDLLKSTVENDLATVDDWLKHNKLIVNQTKTNAIFINNTRKVNTSPPPTIKLNGKVVHNVSI